MCNYKGQDKELNNTLQAKPVSQYFKYIQSVKQFIKTIYLV